MSDVQVRPRLTCHECIDLLRLVLKGEQVPYYSERYGDGAADELVSDARLAHMNETSAVQRRAEVAEGRDRRNNLAVQRLWQLVFATGKRKTMRTDEVRAALEGDL